MIEAACYGTRSGMKVSMSGLLLRVAENIDHANIQYPDYGYSLRELLKHLQELGKRFYDGDTEVVDEFLQLYCLDENRKKE